MTITEKARSDAANIETGMSAQNTVGTGFEAQSDYIRLPEELQGRLALRPREAAPLIGVGVNRMYELCNRADFPAVHIGANSIIIPVDALRRWLDAQAEKGAAV